MEEALRDGGVPYQIARGTAFYDRKEIKDAVAYLRTIANPADEVNLLRIINTPARGISAATIKQMQAYSLAENTAIDAILANPLVLTNINTRAQNAIAKFDKILQGWKQTVEQDGVDDSRTRPHPCATSSSASCASPALKTTTATTSPIPDGTRLENLGELVSAAQQFETGVHRRGRGRQRWT